MAQAESSLENRTEGATAQKLSVLIDARKFFDGGIGVYIVNLIDALLLTSAKQIGLIVFEQDHPEIEKRYLINLSQIKFYQSACPLYSLSESTALLKGIPQEEYDLFHSPHFTLPMNLKIPSVVTVHDLIHILKPSGIGKPLAARIMIGMSLKRATRVLTVSNSSAADIRSYFSWIPNIKDKIAVIPNSLPKNLANYIKNPAEFLQQRFKLQGNYLLAVISNTKKHKGITDLLLAFNELKNISECVPSDLKLVLAGIGSEKMVADAELFSLINEIDDLRILGKITDYELSNLYAGAQALVVPSLIEGFCIPALEAKAQGVPVIARPVPALKEILDSHDIIAPDFDYSSFYAALESFFASSGEKRRRNSDSLQKYLERFSLTQNAAKLNDVYKLIIPAYV